MARVLRLADVAQSDTINLITGTFKLESGSWSLASGGAELSTETMTLVAASTTEKAVANAVQEFDELLKKAAEYHDDVVEGTSYWLEMNAATENAKRTLLYNGQYRVQAGVGYGPFFEQYAGKMILSLDHHPLWENVSYTTVSSSALSLTTPAWVLSAVEGTEEARIRRVKITNSSTSGYQQNYWFGIRPVYEGTTDFIALWELENGTLGTDAAKDTTTAKNTASPGAGSGAFVLVDFATTTALTRRISVKVDDIIGAGTHYNHFHGEYQVLLRYSLSAAGTCGIEMRTGYATANLTNYRACSPQYVSGTGGWYLQEMGTVTIPAEGGWYGQDADYAKYFTIELAAEGLGSSPPDLYLDCLILVPTRYYAKLKNCYVEGNVATDYAELWTHENDEKTAISYHSSKPIIDVSKEDVGSWYLPRQGGVLVAVAAQANMESMYTDAWTLVLDYFPRWRSYRETS